MTTLLDHLQSSRSPRCNILIHKPEHVCRAVEKWLERQEEEYHGLDRVLALRVIGSLREKVMGGP